MDEGANKQNDIKERSKIYYSSRMNVRKKWIAWYGRISREGDYQQNKTCISEVFNMLDIVLENVYDELVHQSELICEKRDSNNTVVYCYQGKMISFWKPKGVFARRVYALKQFGVNIPDSIGTDARYFRNSTAHGNETVAIQLVGTGYEETVKLMLEMADALINVGMLDPGDRIPSFDDMRVSEGRFLHNGDYKILRFIAEGGMSLVWLCEQPRLRRVLAVKELKPGTYVESLIENECDVLVRLRNEHIPRIYDTFYENGTYYIVMEYIEGMTLDEVYCRRNLTFEQKRKIAIDICSVLAYLHSDEAGIVFVDLKPQNVIIGQGDTAFLIDFGVSKAKDQARVLGYTQEFAAPETVSTGCADERSDVYALGKMLEFLFTYELGGNLEHDLTEIIAVCTAVDPERRILSAATILQKLNSITKIGEETKSDQMFSVDLQLNRSPQIRIIIPFLIVLVVLFIGVPVVVNRVTGSGAGWGNNIMVSGQSLRRGDCQYVRRGDYYFFNVTVFNDSSTMSGHATMMLQLDAVTTTGVKKHFELIYDITGIEAESSEMFSYRISLSESGLHEGEELDTVTVVNEEWE